MLYRGIGPGNETTLTSIAPNKTTFVATNLLPNTNNYSLVHPHDWTTANGALGAVERGLLQTSAVATTPAPANVTATAISDSRITVTWSAVANATVYCIYCA